MSEKTLGRPRGSKDKVLRGPRAGSRKEAMLSLEVGESVIFLVEPGSNLQTLQATISSSFRWPENMSNQGFAQDSGMLVFEGEIPTYVSRVTRVAPPKEVK